MAQQFSSGTFVLYLTDVSLDNFAVSDDGSVKVIDAENIVIVDTSLKGLGKYDFRIQHLRIPFLNDTLKYSFVIIVIKRIETVIVSRVNGKSL